MQMRGAISGAERGWVKADRPSRASVITTSHVGIASSGGSVGDDGMKASTHWVRPLFFSDGSPAELIVELARIFLRAHLNRSLNVENLANAVGVGETTLRRAVRTVCGCQLTAFVNGMRLEQAHAWLSTDRESRTQAEIAAALGFRSSRSFAAAYRRRFGETMSETRRRAVSIGEMMMDVGR